MCLSASSCWLMSCLPSICFGPRRWLPYVAVISRKFSVSCLVLQLVLTALVYVSLCLFAHMVAPVPFTFNYKSVCLLCSIPLSRLSWHNELSDLLSLFFCTASELPLLPGADRWAVVSGGSAQSSGGPLRAAHSATGYPQSSAPRCTLAVCS